MSWWPLPIAFAVSFAATGLMRTVSRRLGFVSKPIPSRWSTRVVPLGGGVGIFVGLMTGLAAAGGDVTFAFSMGVLLVFSLGMIDDLRGIGPSEKLLIQVAAACYAVVMGYELPIEGDVTRIIATIVWIVILTNSVNLLDNMDGLASGVVAIAAGSVAVLLAMENPGHPLLPASLVVTGASLGFLVHNFSPARIFMGDAGSLVLGFSLAALSTQVRPSVESYSTFGMVFPLLILLVPIFDTALVIVARMNAGRSVTLGGRDHSSHRLVALGFTDRKAVLILYGAGLLGGGIAIGAVQLAVPSAVILMIAAGVLFALALVFLMEVRVYSNQTDTETRDVHQLPDSVLLLIEVVLDVCVISLAWSLAHLIRFHAEGSSTLWYYKAKVVLPFLPYIVMSKLAVFSGFRMYRKLWRRISGRDVVHILVASAVASLLWILILAKITRFQDVSRLVLIMDAVLTFGLALAVRGALSALRRQLGAKEPTACAE